MRTFLAEELVHVQEVETGVRAQQLHVEEILEAHLIVRLLVCLVLVRLAYIHTYIQQPYCRLHAYTRIRYMHNRVGAGYHAYQMHAAYYIRTINTYIYAYYT